jgi:hypothetical protein
MSISLTQLFAAAVMVVAAFILATAYQRYLRKNSERRMLGMLKSTGLDPTIATSGDIELTMKVARTRCRHCNAEDKCERWLQGREEGSNAFCPNHRVFDALGKFSGAVG